jgi:hypothetical protein
VIKKKIKRFRIVVKKGKYRISGKKKISYKFKARFSLKKKNNKRISH